jgi:hypothetical protein
LPDDFSEGEILIGYAVIDGKGVIEMAAANIEEADSEVELLRNGRALRRCCSVKEFLACATIVGSREGDGGDEFLAIKLVEPVVPRSSEN